MKNILIMMSDNRNISDDLSNCDYNSLTTFINYEYCKFNKYKFVYLKPSFKELSNTTYLSSLGCERHFSWAKLLSSIYTIQNKHLFDCDYVVYVDSDFFFTNFNLKIEEFVKTMEPNKTWDILFSCDLPGSDKACAGFFIFKNNKYSLDFFKTWYSSTKYPRFNVVHTWEQYVLQNDYNVNKFNFLTLNYSFFINSSFVNHSVQLAKHIPSPLYKHRKPQMLSKIEEICKQDSTLKFKSVIREAKEYIVEYKMEDIKI